jgi:hypothetical protein
MLSTTIQDSAMNTNRASHSVRARFELCYRSLSPHRCGFAFPCNERGQVNLDELSDEARENYLYARAMVGRDLLQPQILMAH